MIPFYKYQGAGNDFIMVDQREKTYIAHTDKELVSTMCDRRFGIGADGLILLENGKQGEDFQMIYFNADGSESSMCGNGGRCIVAFANFLKCIKDTCTFNAIDGLHDAKVTRRGRPMRPPQSENWIELKMIDVNNIEIGKDYYLMNTGSPHFVVFVEDLDDIDVYENGREIRYSARFKKEGVNVNFVEILPNNQGIQVATYERGVEAETFSCGTGVTAAAIAYYINKNNGVTSIPILTKGGNLKVSFQPTPENNFNNIWLCGPATQVFKGKYKT
jgi:diaminopimelate epimerase